jgi:hypothetical protein
MLGDKPSQAQSFWNRTKAAGWSDEQTRSQIRREAGVIQEGLNFIFSDGSVVRDDFAPLGRKLVVRERQGYTRAAESDVLSRAAI